MVMPMLSKINHANKLSPSEQYLWDYLAQNRQTAMQWSITELSEHANVSTATIVRTLKKKGFTGYTDFRHGRLKTAAHNIPYSVLENADEQIQNVVMQNEEELKNTLKNLQVSVIEDTIQLLTNAPLIYLFARGLSETIAEEMELKLQLLNKQVAYFHDPNIIKQIATKVKPHSAAVFITLNGQTPELVAAARTLSKMDIPQIVLTANPQAPILKYTDELFLGYQSFNNLFDEYEVHSRLSLQIMSRILLDSYVVRTQTNNHG